MRVIGWNWAKGYVEQQVEQTTGRDFTIAGELDIDLSLSPLIRAEDIRLGNAPWGRFPNMATIETLRARIDLIALLRGRIVIPELLIRAPVVHLAVSPRCQSNWRLNTKPAPQTAPAPGQGGALPVIHRLAVEEGKITYDNDANGADLTLRVARLQGYTDATRNEIALVGEGRLGQQPWRFALRAGSFQMLDAATEPYPVDLALALADTRANVEGTLTEPMRLRGADLSVSVEGLNLSMLAPFFDGARPRLPRHKIAGRLTQAGTTWRLRNFKAAAGKSELRGEWAFDTSGERPTIEADLASTRLRYGDFANLAPPSRTKKPQPLDLSVLSAVDAVIEFRGDEILTPAVAMRDARIAARLNDGRLRIDPIVDIGGGRIRAHVVIDASPRPFEAYAEADIHAVHLSELGDRAAAIDGLEGVLSGRLAVRATGATPAQVANAAPANPLAVLDNLVIDNSRVAYRVPGRDTRLRVTMNSNVRQGLEIEGGGTWRGEDFELALTSDPLLNLANTKKNQPYAIDGTASGAGVEAHVAGALAQPLSLDGVDLAFSASGAGTGRLSAVFTSALPKIARFDLQGQLTRHGTRWKIADFDGEVGESDLAGDLTVDTAGKKPYIKAELLSRRLDSNDFAGLLKQDEPRRAQARATSRTKSPLKLDVLQSVNADVHLKAEEIISPELPVERLTADIALHAGRLTVKPFKLGLGAGAVRGTLVLDSAMPVRGALTIDIAQVDMREVAEPLDLKATFGVLDGHAELSFVGATPKQIAAREQTVLSTIHSFSIEDARFTYREPESRTDLDMTVATTTTANGSEPIRVRGGGRYQGEPFDLDVTAGSPLRLLDRRNAYPIDASIAIVKTEARLAGDITQPLKLKGLSLSLALKGPNPNQLRDFIGMTLPNLPPYEIKGELARDGDIWRFEDFRASTGNSDLAGDLSLTTAGKRMFLRAELVSETLDFAQISRPTEPAANGPVISDTAIDFSPPRAVDAEVSYRATRIHLPGQMYARVATELLLDEGRLTLDPLKFDYLGGTFDSHIAVAANETPVHTSLDIKLQKLSLNEILAKVDAADQATGVISGRVTLEGDGRSPADFAASADGDVWLVMRDGRINEMLMEAAGLSLIESLSLIDAEGSEKVSRCTVEGPWCADGSEQVVPDDPPEQHKQSGSVNVRCLVADFRARDGVLAAQTLIMDTADTKVVGSGTIDLGSESVDLTLLPHAKDFSLLAGQAPLHIRGGFRELNVEVSMARIAFSLLTPIELGDANPADCQQSIQTVRQQ